MEEHAEPAGAGCLVGTVGAGAGVAAWTVGARPHLHGDFEGNGRDLSVLYGELPVMALGVPTAAVAVLLLVHAVLRERNAPGGRGVRVGVPALAGLLTAAMLVWGCLVWLDSTEPPVFQERPGR